jgi:hypothetical protein
LKSTDGQASAIRTIAAQTETDAMLSSKIGFASPARGGSSSSCDGVFGSGDIRRHEAHNAPGDIEPGRHQPPDASRNTTAKRLTRRSALDPEERKVFDNWAVGVAAFYLVLAAALVALSLISAQSSMNRTAHPDVPSTHDRG